MEDQYYDNLLNINTTGHKYEVNHSIHYHPYEPTPYSALVELFKHYELLESDYLVDFGCGKGRLNFFIQHQFRANATGIEMNERFFKEAIQNKQTYMKKFKVPKQSIQFYCSLAEQYEIQPDDNKFYFFNPFSVQIFMKVVHNILRSVEENKRAVDLILYYPSDDYLHFLNNQTSFELMQIVNLHKLFNKDQNERFIIYRLNL